jgi:CRP-like cAMP-binding protein
MRPSKEHLRTVLTETGSRMGLPGPAIDELVRQAQLGHWRKHQHIFEADDTSDLINFLVSGAVKVTCPAGAETVCVQMVRPGQFFGLNWMPQPGRPRQFVATAFTDSVVALVPSETMARICASAPPRAVLQILTYSWRALSSLLYEKCCLLGLGLEDRLVHELGVLARDFGRPQPDGSVRIELPLTHADLAAFALGSRANVTRAMKRLERGGLAARDGRKIVLTAGFFRADAKHFHLLARNGWRPHPRRVA